MAAELAALARLLCGGFSGSAVLQVKPATGESVVVKLDKAANVQDEAKRTQVLMKLVGDNAPRLLGDAVVCGEHGGLKLELVGSCFTLPEQAESASALAPTRGCKGGSMRSSSL